MRLSEKTLELNICAQATATIASRGRLLWFGLTQKQEARAGFDACTRLGGRLLIFQFKASNHVLRSGVRRFLAPHPQLQALQRITMNRIRSVFYAFPLIGNTLELKANPDLLPQTWLLDVASLPILAAPTTPSGSIRKNGCHNVYVRPGHATIRSEPTDVQLMSFAEVADEAFGGSDGLMQNSEHVAFGHFWEQSRHFARGARGVVIW